MAVVYDTDKTSFMWINGKQNVKQAGYSIASPTERPTLNPAEHCLYKTNVLLQSNVNKMHKLQISQT